MRLEYFISTADTFTLTCLQLLSDDKSNIANLTLQTRLGEFRQLQYVQGGVLCSAAATDTVVVAGQVSD